MGTSRNIFANYAGSFWSVLMSLAFIPLYLRFLGAEAYGLIGVFATLQAWFVILDMGLSPTLNREMARFRGGGHTPRSIRELFSSLEIIYSLTAILIAVSIILLAPWIAGNWLQVQDLPLSTVSRALGISGILTGFGWLTGLYVGALYGLQQMLWLNVARSIIGTLRGLGAVAIVAWIVPSVEAFFAWQGLMSLVEMLVLRFKIRRTLPPAPDAARFSKVAIGRVIRFAGGMTVLTLLTLLLTQADKLLLSKLLSLRSFGYYTLAASVATSLTRITTPISTATLPRLTELTTSQSESIVKEAYHLFSQLICVIVIPATLVLAVFSQHLLLLWTRDVVVTGATSRLVSLLVVGSALNGLMQMPYQLQLANGWTRLSIAVNAVAVCLLVPAIWFGVTRFGAIAAPIIWIVLNSGYVLIGVPLMHRRLLTREMWRWYFKDVGLPTLGAGIGVALVALFSPRARIDTPLVSAVVVFAAAVLSLSGSILTSGLVRKRVFAKLGRLLSRDKWKNRQRKEFAR